MPNKRKSSVYRAGIAAALLSSALVGGLTGDRTAQRHCPGAGRGCAC